MTDGPVGFIDSGTGGLSVLKSAFRLLPDENYIYIADSDHNPYGDKAELEVAARVLTLVEFLLEKHNVKALVLACNTATSCAVEALRARFDIPVIGVEPGLKPAFELSLSKKIGVLATPLTARGDKYQRLLAAFPEVEFYTEACAGLADAIENMHLDYELMLAKLNQYVGALLENNVDQIVLGCTHYALVKDEIENIAGVDVNIVETADAIITELETRLKENNALSGTGAGRRLYLSNRADADRVFTQILGLNIKTRKLAL
jgi:glutamate racemase